MNAMVVSQPRLNLVEIRYDIKDPLKEVVLRLGEFLVTLCNVGEEKTPAENCNGGYWKRVRKVVKSRRARRSYSGLSAL